MDGDLGGARPVQTRIVSIFAEPRKAEVEDVGAGASTVGSEVEHDVGRLEVSVDDASRVGMAQRGEDLVDHGPDDAPSELGRVHPLVHAAPGQDIHDEEGAAVGQLAEVAGPDDGRVREEGDGAGLLIKPPALLRAAFPLLGRTQAFERDAIPGHDVAAQVDDPHAAAAELAHDLVALRQYAPHITRRLLYRRHAPERGRSLAHLLVRPLILRPRLPPAPKTPSVAHRHSIRF